MCDAACCPLVKAFDRNLLPYCPLNSASDVDAVASGSWQRSVGPHPAGAKEFQCCKLEF